MKQGDTLESVAQANGTNVQALLGANPTLANPNAAVTGSAIALPGVKQVTSTGSLSDVTKAVYSAVSKVPNQNDIGAVTAAGKAAISGVGVADPVSAAIAPIVSQMQSMIQAIMAPGPTYQSLASEYQSLTQSSGLESINTQMMNLGNVMNGTEDDIRSEITAGGGFASDSQVQAMATSRNKVLLKQYNALSAQQSVAEDYVKNTMTYESADQGERDNQQSLALSKITSASGILDKMTALQQTILSNASSQYSSIVSNVGYNGLASIVAGDPYQQSLAEESLGLPVGTLSNPDLVANLGTKTQSAQLLSAAKTYFSQNGEWPAWYDPSTGQLTGAAGAPSGAGAPASGSTGNNVVGGIDFGAANGVGAYASDVQSEVSGVSSVFNDLTTNGTDLGTYIKNNAPTSPVTADMINSAATKYGIDPNILAATLANESNFGTAGAGAKTMNPGNVGNTDDGSTKTMASWNDGVDAAAHQLSRRKATSAGTTPVDPVVQAYVDGIKNGTITSIASVPKQYKSRVATTMDDQNISSPLSDSRYTMAANRIVGNFIALPQYQLTANGLPYLQRIAAAEKTPGSVSDQDLLDSLTKLNTAGNAISDAQVSLITDGKSFADTANVAANKLKNGGVLSDSQRSQIQKIATAIYDNYKTGYQPVYDQATAQLTAAGIPEAYWTIPDLNTLSAGQTGGSGSQSGSDLVNAVLTAAGASYDQAVSMVPKGQIGVIRNGQFGSIPADEYDPSTDTKI